MGNKVRLELVNGGSMPAPKVAISNYKSVERKQQDTKMDMLVNIGQQIERLNFGFLKGGKIKQFFKENDRKWCFDTKMTAMDDLTLLDVLLGTLCGAFTKTNQLDRKEFERQKKHAKAVFELCMLVYYRWDDNRNGEQVK